MNGAEFKNYRHMLGISQQEIARRLPCSVSAVSGWEQDKNDPPGMTQWFFKFHGVEI